MSTITSFFRYLSLQHFVIISGFLCIISGFLRIISGFPCFVSVGFTALQDYFTYFELSQFGMWLTPLNMDKPPDHHQAENLATQILNESGHSEYNWGLRGSSSKTSYV